MQVFSFDYADFYSLLILVLVLLGCLLFLIGLLVIGWLFAQSRRLEVGPYSKEPLRRWTDLSYATIGKIYLYLTKLHQYDNRMFNIHRIAFCRETGRVFPDAVDRFGRIRLDWTFLQRRHAGDWVSWGSLTYAQQSAIRQAHVTLADFQTEVSSSNPSPRLVEPQYALAKPGPLYVDLHKMVLMGWKIVPGTEIELLIVQHPKRTVFPTQDKKIK